MITTYTFGKKNNNNSIPFSTSSKPNYSKILDDLVIADVIKKNSYLFDTYNDYLDDLLTSKPLKDDNDEFIKAAKFLANYKKNYYKLPKKYIYGKMYTLSDGTPVVFYDDEIQIGFDTYKYTDFGDTILLNTLPSKTKKIIINIYLL